MFTFNQRFALFCAQFFVISLGLSAQNLVLNPSFEIISGCPIGPSELDRAANWSNPFINLLTDTCSTSDLYNSCNFLGAFGVDVPANILGNEPARTGNGYAGIILSERIALFGCTSIGGSNWREYVQGTLSQPLLSGQTYCVTFYVSRADGTKFATDDIGVHFSNAPLAVTCSGAGPLSVTPQLVWPGGVLTSSSGWTELQWTYAASGGERNFTIGNFLGDGSTTINCADAGAFNPYAYYYVDDVSVVAGVCTVLPVTLSTFTAEEDGGMVKLAWTTTAEEGNAYFTVERALEDEGWEIIGKVDAQDNKNGSGEYEIWDEILTGNSLFRLSQTDMNGDHRYLETISLWNEKEVTFTLTEFGPNPARNALSFALQGAKGDLEIRFLDFSGRLLRTLELPEGGLHKTTNVSVADLPAGRYFIEFRTEAGREVRPLLIER